MTANFINPFLDWSFKYLFGHEDIMIGFLNLLLEPHEKIHSITYLDKDMAPADENSRECVFDILCENENKDKFLVEMQMGTFTNMVNRMVYYSALLIADMGEKGRQYHYELDKVYSICITNFEREEWKSKVRIDARLKCEHDGSLYSDKLNYITLQLPNIKSNSISECRSNYEKLLTLLVKIRNNMATTEELLAEIDALQGTPEATKAVFRRVVKTVDYSSLNPEQRKQYQKDLKRYRDYFDIMENKKEEGRVEGKEEGIISVAKNMKTNGYSVKEIMKLTGLQKNEIDSL